MIYGYSGSRSLKNIDIKKYIKNDADMIITGGAVGIDKLVEDYARENTIKGVIIKPQYEKYGKWAPLARNKIIVEMSDCLVAIWDGKSKGTKFTIDYAKKLGKPVNLYIIDNEN